MKLFLDDERPAPEGWTLVRWPEEAIPLLAIGGKVTEISLDHDLGDDTRGTGYDVVKWIEEAVATRGFIPPKITIHSANPAARERMEAGIRNLERMSETGLARYKWACPVPTADRENEHFRHLRTFEPVEGMACTYSGGGPESGFIIFSPDGESLLVNAEGQTALLDAATGACRSRFDDADGAIRSAAFNPDGSTLATAEKEQVVIRDAVTGKQVRALGEHLHLDFITFCPDGCLIGSGQTDFVAHLDTATGKTIRVFDTLGAQPVRRGDYPPDGTPIFGVWGRGGVGAGGWRYAPATGDCTKAVDSVSDLQSWSVSPDGKVIAFGFSTWEKAFALYDLDTGQCRHTEAADLGCVYGIIFTPDGRHFITGSEDGPMRLWETETGRCISSVLIDPEGGTCVVAFAVRGDLLAVFGDDCRVRMYRLVSA